MNRPWLRSSQRAVVWVAACCTVCGCQSRDENAQSAPKVDELREIAVSGPAPEVAGADLFSSSHYSQRDLLDAVDEVAKQPKLKGVFLRLSGLGGAWARGAELRSALGRVRAAHKPVHCYFDAVDNLGYAVLASSCDRITMEPSGLLALTGVRAEALYAKELLDQIGVQADLLQVGRFKGAADPLTRNDMPADVRSNMNNLVDDLQANLMSAVTTGRNLDAGTVTGAIDSGPLDAQRALQMRLVDAVAFADEARAKAKQAASAERVVVALRRPEQHPDLGDLLHALLGGGKREKPQGRRIALAYLTGMIHDEQRDSATDGAASGPFIAAMHRMADDSDIRAVVLRIDSPGGSALASDKMWHAVQRVAKRKPLIVSIGDMAASGGYYVACAGSEIFAEDDSLVGSIGVVGGKIVAEPIADRLGIHSVSLTRGRNANWTSLFHPFSDSERAAVQTTMNAAYATFLSRVRDGRKLDEGRLNAVAEGRIMSGKRARAGGLVDTAGGLVDALARAREKGGVEAEAPIEIWPHERTFFERASQLLSGGETQAPAWQRALSALPAYVHIPARIPVVDALLQSDGSPLAILPYALELR